VSEAGPVFNPVGLILRIDVRVDLPLKVQGRVVSRNRLTERGDQFLPR